MKRQPTRHTPTPSRVLAALDLGQVLSGHASITIHAEGTCMYPTVRPGDVLQIRPCRACAVKAGDIAVIRFSHQLLCHRVIATGERDERAYVVTRPDQLNSGNDAPTFDEDLVGVVDTITRHGKPVSTTPPTDSWLGQRYNAARRAVIQAAPRACAGMANGLALVQSRRLYRWIARRMFALTHPRLAYFVRVPLNDKLGNIIYRQLQSKVDWRTVLPERAHQCWTLVLHVNETRAPAAWATFVRDAHGVWCVEESYVRVRCRGLGLEDTLLQQAEKILTPGV